MNRAQRRRLKKQGKKVEKGLSYNVSASKATEEILKNPVIKDLVKSEVTRILLERDKQYAIDVDAMVMFTLHKELGWGKKRLRKFYLAMFRNHLAMRNHYLIEDTYPERYKLKEQGVDLDAWYNELFDEFGNYKNPEEVPYE